MKLSTKRGRKPPKETSAEPLLSSSKPLTEDTTSGQPKTMSEPAGFPSWTVYTSIKDIVLDVFVDYLISRDTSLLVISGEPPAEELSQAALNLVSQYQEAISNVQSKHHLRMVADVEQARMRIDRVSMLCQALKPRYAPVIVEELKLDGFDFAFTEESYLADVEKVETRLKSELVKFNVRNKQLQDFNEEHSQKPFSRKEIIRTLQAASQMDGVHYQIKKITVEEYCELVNRLMEQAQSNTK